MLCLFLKQECPNTKSIISSSMKRRLVFSVLCVLALSLLSSWQQGFLAPMANAPSAAAGWAGGRNVTVLLWYWPFNKKSSLKGDVCWDLYGIPRCRLVDQRSYFPSADVVVFHNRELVRRREKLPLDLPRPQGQRWAWMSLEAPDHNGNLHRYANIFNMTITYRRDADVPIPYGEMQPQQADGLQVQDPPSNKSFLVCWVVSNYKKHHKRSQVYGELRAAIPVQVYGRWNRKPLTSGALLPTISRCHFYLSFENSLSRDYITEKLWRNAYRGGAVPVVLGPPLDDYKAVAPPRSFIHVDQFATVNDLAEYLQRLAGDERRYGEYLAWRSEWRVKLLDDWRERLCRICPRFHRLPQQKVYTDLEAWVNGAATATTSPLTN